jgi:hypothetical protein
MVVAIPLLAAYKRLGYQLSSVGLMIILVGNAILRLTNSGTKEFLIGIIMDPRYWGQIGSRRILTKTRNQTTAPWTRVLSFHGHFFLSKDTPLAEQQAVCRLK